MSLRDEIQHLNDLSKTLDGEWFGVPFNVYRPDYTSNTAPERLLFQRYFRYEQLGPKLTEPNLPEVEYFGVFGNMNGMQPGDVLIDPAGQCPTMVMSTTQATKETHAFRADRKCTIVDYLDDSGVPDATGTILSNARYSWLKRSESFGQHGKDLSSITQYPGRRVVMYPYKTIVPQNYDIQGKKLLETDGTLVPPRRWIITLAEYTYPLVILTLEEETT